MPKWLLIVIVLILLAAVPVYRQLQRVGNPWVAWGPAEELKVTRTEIGGQVVGGFSLPEGTALALFAEGLGKPRDLEWAERVLLVTVPSNGQVVALPDTDKNGMANTSVLLSGLNKPHGLAYQNGLLFVAEETAVKRYRFNPATLEISLEKKIVDLPSGGRHTSRTLDFDRQGRLFIAINSTCDVCEEANPWLTTVIVTNQDGNNPRVFSKGLRNPVFIKHNKASDQMWVTEMGRDFLGDNLPPDEINVLTDGGDFGWPYCYGEKVWDSKFGRRDQAFCNTTQEPKFALPAHVAPLGLTFIDSPLFPSDWQGDLLVALHGSWNSTVPVGYKIVRLDVSNGSVTEMHDLITGFLKDGEASSRPVDVEFGSSGELYVSDDKGGKVFVLR